MTSRSMMSDRYLPGRSALPLLETGVIQIGRGAARFDITMLLGKDMAVVRQKVAPKLAGYVVPDPAWLVLFIPMHWSSDFIFNGVHAEPGDMFLSCSPSGYSTVGSDRDTLAIGVRTRVVIDACARLMGLHLEDLTLKDGIVGIRRASGQAIERLTLAFLQDPESIEKAPGCFLLSEAREIQLIEAVAAALFPGTEQQAERRMWNATPLRVVRLAEEAVRASPERPVSLADLCRATGVSNGWLHRCFDEIYSLSPGQCARRWRMTAARDALLDRGSEDALVKQVALRFGFSNSGRFASEYRSVFGESPSQTMLRRRKST